MVRAVIAALLEEHRRLRPPVRFAGELAFEGTGGKDVYNPTAPFAIGGRAVLAARVESADRETDSEIVFFEGGPLRWRPVPGAPRLALQDPAVARVGGELVVAGVEVWGEEGALSWRTVFHRGASLGALRPFAAGPDGMKDIRLAELDDGRVLVLTRPQGARGGRGKIGATVIAGLDALTPAAIDAAPLLEGQFADDEWGGANELVRLDARTLGVLGHVACFDPAGARHYYPIAFTLDAVTLRPSPLRILFERADLPGGVDGPAKRPDLRDVLFSGGIVRGAGGLATVYVGAGDKVVYAVEIPDPFALSSRHDDEARDRDPARR